MSYKSFYGLNNFRSMTDISNDSNGGYISTTNASAPIYDSITHKKIGCTTYSTIINKLDPNDIGLATSGQNFFFDDGVIRCILSYKNDVPEFPTDYLVTTVLNASGAYFSAIGNPIVFDIKPDRIDFTVKLK